MTSSEWLSQRPAREFVSTARSEFEGLSQRCSPEGLSQRLADLHPFGGWWSCFVAGHQLRSDPRRLADLCVQYVLIFSAVQRIRSEGTPQRSLPGELYVNGCPYKKIIYKKLKNLNNNNSMQKIATQAPTFTRSFG